MRRDVTGCCDTDNGTKLHTSFVHPVVVTPARGVSDMPGDTARDGIGEGVPGACGPFAQPAATTVAIQIARRIP